MIGCKAEVGGDEGDEEEKEAGGGVKNLSLAPLLPAPLPLIPPECGFNNW
jgi:hypothetical protein